MEQRLRGGSGERRGLKITERIEFAQFSHRATSKGDKCLFLAHMAVPVMFCACLLYTSDAADDTCVV